MSELGTDKAQKRRKIPWVTIKREYIHGEPSPSLRDLAAKYQISETAIAAHSSKQGWPALRDAAHARAEVAVTESEVERRASVYAEWDNRHLSAAQLIHIAAQTGLTESLQAKASMPDTLISSTDMEKYARMAKVAMEIERTVHGRTTQVVDQTMHGELLNITPEHLEAIRERQEQRVRDKLASEARA